MILASISLKVAFIIIHPWYLKLRPSGSFQLLILYKKEATRRTLFLKTLIWLIALLNQSAAAMIGSLVWYKRPWASQSWVYEHECHLFESLSGGKHSRAERKDIIFRQHFLTIINLHFSHQAASVIRRTTSTTWRPSTRAPPSGPTGQGSSGLRLPYRSWSSRLQGEWHSWLLCQTLNLVFVLKFSCWSVRYVWPQSFELFTSL